MLQILFGSLLRADILFSWRPWLLDPLVMYFILSNYVNLVILDLIKNKILRILPLYFFLNDALRIFKKIDINKLLTLMYFFFVKIKRSYKILTYYKRLFIYYFHVFREDIMNNAIIHSLGNIRKVSSQLFAFLIKFGYKFKKVFLASLKDFFIKILFLKNVQKKQKYSNT